MAQRYSFELLCTVLLIVGSTAVSASASPSASALERAHRARSTDGSQVIAGTAASARPVAPLTLEHLLPPSGEAPPCSCANVSWCKPLTTPLPAKELFTFRTHSPFSATAYEDFSWNHITTLAYYDALPPALMCKAHSLGVRLVTPVGFPPNQLTNLTYIQLWAERQAHTMSALGIDGINLDFEHALAKDSPQAEGLSTVMQALRKAMKAVNPMSQLSFDAPVRPTYEGRFYDYNALAAASDFLVLMCYDLNDYDDPPSDNDGSLANSPLWVVQEGIKAFQSVGIAADDLVMAVPWYGYDYVCAPGTTPPCANNSVITILNSQINFWVLEDILHGNATSGRLWSKTAMSPYFNYQTKFDGLTVNRQIWYDDPQSISLKVKFAVEQQLRGVGMWTATKLNYADGGNARTREMWDALNAFFA